MARRRPGRRRRASSPAPTTTPPTCRWSPRPARVNPDLFVAARQNRPASAAAVRGDGRRLAAGADRGGRARGVRAAEHAAAVAVPARDARPGRRLGGRLDRPADRATAARSSQALWKVRLNAARGAGARAVAGARRSARLGDLLRNPEDREEPLPAVALLVLREGEEHPRPGRRLRARARGRAAAGRAAGGAPGAGDDADRRRRCEYVVHRPAGAVELDLAQARAGASRTPTSWMPRPAGGTSLSPVRDEDLQGLVRRRLWELARTPAEAARLGAGPLPAETIERMARRGGTSFISEGMASSWPAHSASRRTASAARPVCRRSRTPAPTSPRARTCDSSATRTSRPGARRSTANPRNRPRGTGTAGRGRAGAAGDGCARRTGSRAPTRRATPA